MYSLGKFYAILSTNPLLDKLKFLPNHNHNNAHSHRTPSIFFHQQTVKTNLQDFQTACSIKGWNGSTYPTVPQAPAHANS
jgi:hypothetical protein